MIDQFSVLPAPPGYQLIEIDDNAVDGNIHRWISQPEPVIGFVIRKQEHCFSVLPVTVSQVYTNEGKHALIRPDGTIDSFFMSGGGGGETFRSIADLKSHILRFHAQCFREMAEDEKDRKESAKSRRHATKLEKEADEFD